MRGQGVAVGQQVPGGEAGDHQDQQGREEAGGGFCGHYSSSSG